MTITPPRLRPGDTIRVIAPSGSFLTPWITDDMKAEATRRLTSMGYRVTFGAHLNEINDFCSSSIESRIADLHDAFRDPDIRLILCTRGGFNVNQLLDHLDDDLIAKNPKILCGFSDITALSNAIFARTGLLGYSGPVFYQFGRTHGVEWMSDVFLKCVSDTAPYSLTPPAHWFDDDGTQHENSGPVVIQTGIAEGTLLGGNLCTLNLLQGTSYLPDLTDSVLFIEDDYESKPHHFDRNLLSLLHVPSFSGVRGVVFGRFQPGSDMTDSLMKAIIRTKPQLAGLPIIINAEFGHTLPLATFPIGGKVRIEAHADGLSRIEILEH